ncbi:MAG: lipopolysaccharide assembly protein LapA domain-containing protein [Sphingomicrobium sp.]
MRFLSTLFWALVAAIVALFSWVNWIPVGLRLWDTLELDIQLPLLLFVVFLLGFLPMWLVMRARVWSLRRRLEALERNRVTAPGEPAAADTDPPVA